MLPSNRLCWTILATIVVDGELATVDVEPFRSKRGVRLMTV